MGDVRLVDAESVSGIHIGMVLKAEVGPGLIVQDVLRTVHHSQDRPDVLLGFERVRPNGLTSMGVEGASCFAVKRNVVIEVVAPQPADADLEALRANLTRPTRPVHRP